jgi:transposase
MSRLFVGIDVSKRHFDVCVKDLRNDTVLPSKRYKQSQEGFEDLDKDLESLRRIAKGRITVGLESTGVYHLNLYEHLYKNGISAHIINPIEIKSRAMSRIRKTRTDKIDASIIAEKLITDARPEQQYRLNDAIHSLREECRILFRLKKMIRLMKIEANRDLNILCPGYDNHFKNCLTPASIAIVKLAFRKTRYLDVSEEDIHKTLESYHIDKSRVPRKARILHELFSKTATPRYHKDPILTDLHMIIARYELVQSQMVRLEKKIARKFEQMDSKITSIPGISTYTGAIIVGEIGDIKRFNSAKQLVAFAGLDPTVKESGESRKLGRISKRGSPLLREALYQASFASTIHNPVCSQYYHRLKARGKHHNICIIAVARKLSHIIYSVLKNDKEFYIPTHINSENTSN